MNPYQSLEASNPGNGSAAEYEFIGELIKQYAPGNILVFSVGTFSVVSQRNTETTQVFSSVEYLA